MKLTPQQVEQFQRDNFLIAEDVLSESDLAPMIVGISQWLDTRARQLDAEGKIDDLCESQPFDRRFALLFGQCPQIDDGLDIMYMQCQAVYEFLRNDNLMDAVESLVGPEITCNPIQHLRAKVPAGLLQNSDGYSGVSVPWHQDAAVTWEEADSSNIITCWIPLTDATRANGCMQVIPRCAARGYLEHDSVPKTHIKPGVMPQTQPVVAECRKGGVIFMTKFTPHHSTNNVSDGIRWSLDLRYQPTGEPTGRPFWPAFVTHSGANPSSVHTDHADWCRQWDEALESSKGMKWHRTHHKNAY